MKTQWVGLVFAVKGNIGDIGVSVVRLLTAFGCCLNYTITVDISDIITVCMCMCSVIQEKRNTVSAA